MWPWLRRAGTPLALGGVGALFPTQPALCPLITLPHLHPPEGLQLMYTHMLPSGHHLDYSLWPRVRSAHRWCGFHACLCSMNPCHHSRHLCGIIARSWPVTGGVVLATGKSLVFHTTHLVSPESSGRITNILPYSLYLFGLAVCRPSSVQSSASFPSAQGQVSCAHLGQTMGWSRKASKESTCCR